MASVTKPFEFTPLARLQLQVTIDYIIKAFNKKSAEKFASKVERHLQFIAEGRVVHRYFYKPKQIRYFIVNRKNYILYQELRKSIRVIGVYSVAQDIDNIIKKLK